MSRTVTPPEFYPFESDQTRALALIPLSVRYKLDRCEIKLHLAQWQQLPLADRQALLSARFTTPDEVSACRALLHQLVDRHFGEPPTACPLSGDEPWMNTASWPQVVVDQCEQQGLPLPALAAWSVLDEAHRHALFVLGRSKHSRPEFRLALLSFSIA